MDIASGAFPPNADNRHASAGDQQTMRFIFTALFALVFAALASAQTHIIDSKRESARSDKFTNGIVRASLVAGDPNIKITINVPSFQMTLWQNGAEVAVYPVGVGEIDYPVAISLRRATSIEWNPVWIPPSSDWIEASSTVKPGEIILPTDPRNPLGKVKIPLGYGYLLHEAKGPQDMGGLVSHGCVRVLRRDIYDLSEKIAAALGLDVTPEQVAAAKRNKKTLSVPIEPALTVEITYDTIVVEDGKLHVYPDVYELKKNTLENVRAELNSSGVNHSLVTDSEIKRILNLVKGKKKYVASVADLEAGKATSRGRYVAVLSDTPAPARAKQAER
jgi:hypothetical protein